MTGKLGDFSGSESRLIPGEFTGYRQWNMLVGGTGLLASLNGTQWGQSYELTAKCRKERNWYNKPNPDPPHRAPDSSCTCGLYHLSFPEDYVADIAGFLPPKLSGVTKCSGKIIFGQLGFRAEKARVIALCMPFNNFPESPYPHRGVKIYRDKQHMWDEHPPDDFSGLFDEQTLTTMLIRQAQHAKVNKFYREHAKLKWGGHA